MTKLATVHPRYARLCVLGDTSQVVTLAEAKEMGYAVVKPAAKASSLVAPTANVSAARSKTMLDDRYRNAAATNTAWASSIENSPEGRERPTAARKLIANFTPHAMSLDRARGFLRGLPPEANARATPAAIELPRNLTRALEIRRTALLARDDEAARTERVKIDYAFKLAEMTKCSLRDAATELGVNIDAAMNA